jgi:RNA polymerase sigma-70 factor (ECF subfamily)
VRRTAANLLRDRLDAEECVNDTWLGVWNSIPPQRPNPLVSYVCRIARNLAVKRWRAETAAKRNGEYDLVLDELAECIPSGMDVESELERRELTGAINRFLDTLGYEDRFLFVRRYWYADSVADIAAATHGSVNRTSVRLFRLREKLRKSLQKEGLTV